MLTRLVLSSSPSIPLANQLRLAVQKAPLRTQMCRQFNQDTREGLQAKAEQLVCRRKTLQEWAKEPACPKRLPIGRGIVAGATLSGLGAIYYYGHRLSKDTDPLAWSQDVRDRIHSTFNHVSVAIILTAGSVAAVFLTPSVFSMVARNRFIFAVGSLVAVVGSAIITRSIPYKEGFGIKQIAWALHYGLMGPIIAPVAVMGGPLLLRAAWYTAWMIGGLSIAGMSAPNDEFLSIAGPVGVGLGAMYASALSSLFLAPKPASGAGLYVMYGGLLVFGAYLWYETQRLVKRAKDHPITKKYDPVNESTEIFLETVKIFIRKFAGGNEHK